MGPLGNHGGLGGIEEEDEYIPDSDDDDDYETDEELFWGTPNWKTIL